MVEAAHVVGRIAGPALAADVVVEAAVAVGDDVEAGELLVAQIAGQRVLVLLAEAPRHHRLEEMPRAEIFGVPARPRQRAGDGGRQNDVLGGAIHESSSRDCFLRRRIGERRARNCDNERAARWAGQPTWRREPCARACTRLSVRHRTILTSIPHEPASTDVPRAFSPTADSDRRRTARANARWRVDRAQRVPVRRGVRAVGDRGAARRVPAEAVSLAGHGRRDVLA